MTVNAMIWSWRASTPSEEDRLRVNEVRKEEVVVVEGIEVERERKIRRASDGGVEYIGNIVTLNEHEAVA